MRVYNLVCQQNHHFEGWFSSENDYLSQKSEERLTCPLCDSSTVHRLPSAPRISRGLVSDSKAVIPQEPASKNQPTELNTAPGSQQVLSQTQVQATVLKVIREIVSQTEDVGTDFAQEARKIHYKEVPERGIRGQATSDETAELKEEGIEVIQLPFLPAVKDKLQ